MPRLWRRFDAPLVAFIDVFAILLLLVIATATVSSIEMKRHLAGETPTRDENRQLRAQIASLSDDLQSQAKKIEELKGKRIIIPNELNGRVFFDSGSDLIRPEFKPFLEEKCAEVRALLMNGYNLVQIEGHTDNEPLLSGLFRDNWELGAARAMSVRSYFETCGLPVDKMAITSRGEYVPVASNDSEEGKSENRRIEIVVMSR